MEKMFFFFIIHVGIKRYEKARIRKRSNQREIPTPKTEVGKTKLTIRYLKYLENTS